MSDAPQNPLPTPLTYATVNPYQAGFKNLKLVGIVNIIIGSLDILWAGVLCVTTFALSEGLFSLTTSTTYTPYSSHPPTPEPSLSPSNGFYILATLLSLAYGILKIIAGIKNLKHSPRARAWGYTAGIVGCTQIWCSVFLFVPLAAGIYTIVAMTLQSTRQALASRSTQTPFTTSQSPP